MNLKYRIRIIESLFVLCLFFISSTKIKQHICASGRALKVTTVTDTFSSSLISTVDGSMFRLGTEFIPDFTLIFLIFICIKNS